MPYNLLRHTIATLAYRAGKTLRGAPADFANFRVAPGSRTPGEILAHMGDLLDWALSLIKGAQAWHNSTPKEWDTEVERFFRALQALDDAIAAANGNIKVTEEKLFQGPIADALTHTGQIAMLRRLAGAPVAGENYYVADITTGRVGAQQARAHKEFV